MRLFGIAVLSIFVCTAGLLGLTFIGFGCNAFSTGAGVVNGAIANAGETISKEFNPSALLKKYEDFKDISAALDAKLASLSVYEKRETNLVNSYEKTPRSKWARSDKEQWNQWENERSGIAASFNELASQYNADMAKFNYRFCNVGQLPQGADKPLPREYKTYLQE